MANSLLHEPQKLIIDTDPGIDDSIAIMMAFESSELKIIGMTTIFDIGQDEPIEKPESYGDNHEVKMNFD
ncbi:hypothetical protein AAHE18_12G153600 [Arachis hypogaea]